MVESHPTKSNPLIAYAATSVSDGIVQLENPGARGCGSAEERPGLPGDYSARKPGMCGRNIFQQAEDKNLRGRT